MFGDGTNSPDLNALFAQAQQMTEQLGEAQKRLAETEVTGTAGGELVTVVTTATGEVKSLTIAPRGLRRRPIRTRWPPSPTWSSPPCATPRSRLGR